MAEIKILKANMEAQNTTIAILKKENKELKKEILRLQEQNKVKEKDMKKKFLELHSEQKTVNTELEKYKAVPEFKNILDLYSQLFRFRTEINDVLKNDHVHQEKRKLEKKIEEYKSKNLELETDLQKRGVRGTTKVRANELQQYEGELRKHQVQSQINYLANKSKITEMQTKMKSSTSKLVGTITNALTEVQKNLEAYKVDLENIKKSSANFTEKPIYEKIMNILLEQQNALMKSMLESARGMSRSTSALDDDSLYDSGSDADEDAAESVHGGTKRYKIIMHNVNEEWADGLPDNQKVKAIIKTFTTLSTDDIENERMGKVNPLRKRPLKIFLPSFQHVQMILKTKQKLQNTCYADIRICSYKNKAQKPNNFNAKGSNF